MSKDLITQSKIPIPKHGKFLSSSKLKADESIKLENSMKSNENESLSTESTSVQDKINPDIFKKIFNRKYKKIAVESSSSSKIPKFVSNKKDLIEQKSLSSEFSNTIEVENLTETFSKITEESEQKEMRVSINKRLQFSTSSSSGESNTYETIKYEVDPNSNSYLLPSKSIENLFTNHRSKSKMADELNNKFKNELDFMLGDEKFKADNLSIKKKTKNKNKSKKSNTDNSSNASSDLEISSSSTSSSLEYDNLISENFRDFTSSHDATLYKNFDSELTNLNKSDDIDEDLSTSLSLSSSTSSLNENLAFKLLKDIKKNMTSPEYEKLLLFLKNTADKPNKFYDASSVINEFFLTSSSYATADIEKYKLENEAKSDKDFPTISIQVDENFISSIDQVYDNEEIDSDDEKDDVFDSMFDIFYKYKLNNDGNNFIEKIDLKNNQIKVNDRNNVPVKKSLKDLLRMDRINESAHENSSSLSSSQNKEELNVKLNSNIKVCDETLRDAENLSDFDDEATDINQDEWWYYDNNKKNKSLDNEIIKSSNDQKLTSTISANNEQNNDNNTKKSQPSGNNQRKKSDEESNKKDDLPKHISTLNEKVNIKNRIYRCDAIVMYDKENNVNFCKLCKLYSFNPPSKIENGKDFASQLKESDLDIRTNENIGTRDYSSGYDSTQNKSKESMKFKNFDFEPETDVSEIKLNFEYEINDAELSLKSNKNSLIKQDEEIIKQRTRDGLKFWKDEDKKNQNRANNDKNKMIESFKPERDKNNDVKSKISVFESIRTDKKHNSKTQPLQKNKQELENLKSKKNDVSEVKKNILNSNNELNVDVGLSKIVNSKNQANVSLTEFQLQENNKKEEENEYEEVEIVIDIGNLAKFPAFGNGYDTESLASMDTLNELTDNLKSIVKKIIPSADVAYIDEIVFELKIALQTEITIVKNVNDLPDYVIDFIETRYQTLLNDQLFNHNSIINRTSDIYGNHQNNYEHTELTIVKNICEQNDIQDDIINLDEETLYIVEKLLNNNKFNDIDKEVRKSFRLKSKDSFDEIINNSLTAAIGHSVNDKFSADALYDLNKQVVYRNELQKLNEQYNIFRSILINMLDNLKRTKHISIHDTSDYQLHFLHTHTMNKNIIQNIMMISFDKNSSEHFNADKESEHTQMSVFLLRKRFNEASSKSNNVVARINVLYIDDKNFSNFSKFSLLSLNEIENRLNENSIPPKRHFVHVRYFKCSSDMIVDDSVEVRESIIDVNILPQQLRIELLNECERYEINIPNKKTYNVDINIHYENDNLIMPNLTVLVLESEIIQNAINKKRDELISTTLAANSDKQNDKVVELDSFIQAIEQELNSYLICEKIIDRETDLTETKDLVKLNKIDALVSFETVQSFKILFEKIKDFGIFNDPDDLKSQRYDKNTNQFYIMDDGNYYKCLIPVEYINEKLRDPSEPANQSSTLVIENMHKRQNCIFGKHLKSAFPYKQNGNKIPDIRSIRLKQAKASKQGQNKAYSSSTTDDSVLNKLSSFSESENSHSLTLASSRKPDTKYRVTIDYDKNEVTKKEIETQYEFTTKSSDKITKSSELCEFGVQVNDEEKESEKKLIEALINENNFLKEQVNKNNTKIDASCETEFDTKKDTKYTYDMVLDRSSYIDNNKKIKMNTVKIEDLFTNEEFPLLEYETISNDNYIQIDENDIEIMQKRIIRDDIIINEIDKMFHSIRDHQGANQKTKAQDTIRRRSSSWSYSSDKRHVRAKVMELKFFDKERKQQASSKNDFTGNSSENLFLRIDDFLSQNNSRALVRSYSADYLNENSAPRTRIKYIRIPGDIMKTEVITHYQYNVVPSEYRTIPYGLRYWSILKLLQEERESGQPYIYLGDTYVGHPPEEWINSQSVVKDILKNGGNVDSVVMNHEREVYEKESSGKNTDIEMFMSTSNLDQEIEMVKSSEQLLRSMPENLNIEIKPKRHNFTSPIVLSEKMTTYEQLPDRIISTVERVKLEDNKINVNQKIPIIRKNTNYDEVNDHQGIKKYPLIDHVINAVEKSITSNNITSSSIIMNDVENSTSKSTGSYGHYYPNHEQLNSSQSEFINLETIISKRIDDTNNYLKALSADNLLNGPANKITNKVDPNAQYHEFQPKTKIPPRNISKSLKSLKDMTTYERTITIPQNTLAYHNKKEVDNNSSYFDHEYVTFEADEFQVKEILTGNYNFDANVNKMKQNENSSFVFNQLIDLKNLYFNHTMNH